MRKLLHLQHHSHSGRIIHHKHTSYRALFVIVALFSLALAFLQHTVRADNLEVFAKVSADTPTVAASIGSPVNGVVVTEMPLVVEGTCEYVAPASIIEMYSGVSFLGSTPCTTSGTFTVNITLTPGTHQLVARTVNITDDYGPDSLPVSVTYAPVLPPEPPTTGHPSSPQGQPINPPSSIASSELRIRSKYTYITYGPSKDPVWVGSFEGGTPPYKITIDWGDGTTITYDNVNTSEQSFRHRYKEFVSYFISVTATDITGTSLTREFAAVTPYTALPNGTSVGLLPILDEDTLQALIYGNIAVLSTLSLLVLIHRHPAPLPKRKSRLR